jgi:hypothetical protein
MQTVVTLLWIALTPTAVAGAAVLLPRAVRAARRRLARQSPQPAGPPLEQVAADLRRLLAEHGRVVRTPQLPARGRRLGVLEAALTDRALDAARALGLEVPARAGGSALPVAELRRLLLDLARSGVVLPEVERFGAGRG